MKSRNEELEDFREQNLKSLRFAAMLQEAIFPTEQQFRSILNRYIKILRPQQIIGGDFIWCREVNDKVYLACVDCTGHGTPSALLSMAGYFSLNMVLEDFPDISPDEFIWKLNERFTEYLYMNNSDPLIANQGMELGLIIIDKKQEKLDFSGVGNKLIKEVDGDVEVISSGKGTVGDQDLLKPKLIELPYEKGGRYYLHSDGVIDQFGGSKNKKFLRKRLINLIIETSRLKIEKQLEIVRSALVDWQGDNEQTDDITLIGIELI